MSDRFDLEYLFVLPGTLPYPTGGHKVVYELSKMLSRDGHCVGILFVRDVYKKLYSLTGNSTIKKFLKTRNKLFRLYEIVFNTQVGFMLFLPILRKILDINYKEDFKGIKIFFSTKDLNRFAIKRLIVGSWQASFTAYYSLQAPFRYYFIHHSEDETSFSNELNQLASMSYRLGLKKIVVNKKSMEKFKEDKPLFVSIGHNLDKYQIKTPVEKRDGRTLIVPLRQGEDKGSELAIRVAEFIHSVRDNIKIVTFGNYAIEGIPNFMERMGFVSDDILVNIYNSGSVLFLPSLVEGMSLIGLEAIAAGLCVVSMDNGGIREYIENGINGIILQKGSVEEIGESIINIMDDSAKRISLVRSGMETVSKFTNEAMYSRFLIEINEYETSFESMQN